jgi:hypothetical protein
MTKPNQPALPDPAASATEATRALSKKLQALEAFGIASDKASCDRLRRMCVLLGQAKSERNARFFGNEILREIHHLEDTLEKRRAMSPRKLTILRNIDSRRNRRTPIRSNLRREAKQTCAARRRPANVQPLQSGALGRGESHGGPTVSSGPRRTRTSSRSQGGGDPGLGDSDGPPRGRLPLYSFADLHRSTPYLTGSERLAAFDTLPLAVKDAMWERLRADLEGGRGR